jgi:hypothetical protein
MTGAEERSQSGPAIDADAFEAVEAWAKSWFVKDGADVLGFDGLPVGWALHTDIFEAVLAAILPALGRPQRVVGRPVFRRFKLTGWDREARAWAMRMMRGRQAPRAAEIAFVSELATPSALGGLLAVAAALPLDALEVAAADPRTLKAWRTAGHRTVPLLLALGDERRRLSRARKEVRDRWEAGTVDPTPLIVGGRDLTSVAVEAARPIVRRSGPWLAVEAVSLARTLEIARPHTVVLASDQHRVGRLACHVAQEHGVRSVVLQHGLPQSTLGYLPLAADRFLAWSAHAVDWFAARGAPRDRFTICGNPRLDARVRRQGTAHRPADTGAPLLDGSPRLMAALSVAPTEVNLRLLDLALAALAVTPRGTLLVKLHPGGSDWGSVRKRLAAGDVPRSRLRVAEREDIHALIEWADVVLVHRSTVAIDALAAGRPVVVVSAATPSIAEVELRELDLPQVATGTELAAVVRSLAKPADADRYWAGRHSRLERILGPLDGLAAQRAAAVLLERTGPSSAPNGRPAPFAAESLRR